MVLSAAQASIVMYDQAAVADAASWAARLAVGSRPLELAASVIRAFAETQAGHGVRAAEILDDCQAGLGEEDPLAIGQVVLQAAVCELALERFDQAHALLDLIVQRARDAGAGGSLAMQLPWAALLDLADGRWMDALAEAHEAVHLIEETGWDGYRPMAFSVLARVEAGMGRAECVAHANSAIAAADQLGASPMEAHAHAALGFYHLGLQAWTAAADEFEEALRLASFSAAPLLRVQFLPDLIEANFRAARTGRAAELMAEFDDIAARMQRPSAVVLAARCRGLLALGDPESEFRKALDGGDATVPRFNARAPPSTTATCCAGRSAAAKQRCNSAVLSRNSNGSVQRPGPSGPASGWIRRPRTGASRAGCSSPRKNFRLRSPCPRG